jgi:glycosyltransferase involved in cell wall biosynthesis
MKILVICQYYYPEPFKIHEICEGLVNRGHEVTVITGRPNYPDGILFEGYEDKMNEKINGVTVIRTPITLRGNNSLSLIRNYLSYPKLAKKEIDKLNDNFDIVFVYQLSPVFMIYPALYYKKKYKKKVYVYCLDLWPESLKVLHIKENDIIYKIMKKICNYIYKKCDYISVTSPDFMNYIHEINGVDKNKINFIPQHGENMFLKVLSYKHHEKLNITFAGNIGKAQDFDTLVKAVKEIPNQYYSKLRITIIGSGSYEDDLKYNVKINNLEDIFYFEGRKRVEELLPYYNNATLFLLSLEKGSHISNTIPSKLQTYMSAGRGIIGSIDGPSASIIKEANAGKVCKAGDYKELSNIIMDMLNKNDEYFKELSINSREYFMNHFTLDKYIDSITNTMEEIL